MANIQPSTPHTIGNAITEAEAAIRERLAVLEIAAKTEESNLVSWVKANWPHVVTWLSSGTMLFKLFNVL
jgi:hypothetical protein